MTSTILCPTGIFDCNSLDRRRYKIIKRPAKVLSKMEHKSLEVVQNISETNYQLEGNPLLGHGRNPDGKRH